jgi:V8-like Glu-specific endopeptidase
VRALFLLAVLAVGCGSTSGEGTSGSEDDIVGGVEDNADPAVVAINIVATGFTVCTGSLITHDVVLTAGHCPQSAIWVRQGSNVRDLGWRSHIAVDESIRHPNFTGEGKAYDVSLLRLERAVDDVAPVSLSTRALATSDVGTTIRHVGFGTTGDDWKYTKQIGTGGVKREVTYPITKVDDFFVYSGGPGKQTCIFDSGGPAFLGDHLIAIVSAGNDCHSDGWDTRIDRPDILEWIDHQLELWGTRRISI